MSSQTPDVRLTSSARVKGEILPLEGLELSKVLNCLLASELLLFVLKFWFLCIFVGVWHFLSYIDSMQRYVSINLKFII